MKKSFMTRMLAVSLSAAMTFSLSSASSLTATEAAAKKLPANNKAVSISLKVGKSKVLKLKNYKAWNIKKGATNKKAVAAVANKGTAAKRTIKVTAKKKGTAKVTLTLGKRKTADSKTTKYSKTIKKVVTVKVKAADTASTDTTPTDTTPTDTTPTAPSTTTGSATNVTPGVLHISEAKAAHVDVIAVSFSSIVTSQAGVKVTVTRGEQPIDGKFTFDASGQGGEFKTVGKLTKGTYVVTATDGKDTTTANVEVQSNQEVKSIEFLGDVALTGRNDADVAGSYAYVYYELKDQYGDKVNDTFSAQWTASADIKKVDRAAGRITLQKNKNTSSNAKDVETFNYSDKIYVTGVYTKTGVSGSQTFSVGAEQSVNRIECVGFLEKGKSEIVQSLPKDFKINEYQMLYKAYDQEDHEMEEADYLYDDSEDANRSSRSLTFVSLDVLVIKELVHNEDRIATVNGEDYCAANIVPGINVNNGGDVTVNAIATKTGKTSDILIHVGKYRTLKSFEMQVPSGIIADGEAVEIPFEAIDVDGNKIETFKELATQTNFSKLTLNESVGELRLEEKDNGGARLVWYDTDEDGAVWNKNSTDGVDRPVSLTAIVVGGDTSNVMLTVSDKARPETIIGYDDLKKVYVDGNTIDLSNIEKAFKYMDQYGRPMQQAYDTAKANHLLVSDVIDNNFEKDKETKYATIKAMGNYGLQEHDNGFFAYANANFITPNVTINEGLTGTDFSGYQFGVNVEISGNETDEKTGKLYAVTNQGNPAGDTSYTITSDGSIQLSGSIYDIHKVTDKIPEITVKAKIWKYKKNNSNNNDTREVEDVSKKYSESFKIVPLAQLTNYKIDEMAPIHITTDLSAEANAQKLVNWTGDSSLDIPITYGQLTEDNSSSLSQAKVDTYWKDYTSEGALYKEYVPLEDAKLDYDDGNKVVLKGFYSGNEVKIPVEHFALKNDDAALLTNNEGKFQLTTGNDANRIQYVRAGGDGGLTYADLYNIKSAHYDNQNTTDTIEAYVYDEDTPTDTNLRDRSLYPYLASAKYTVTISDNDRSLSEFIGADTYTMRPDNTVIQLSRLMTESDSYAYDSVPDKEIKIKDQYGYDWFGEPAKADKYLKYEYTVKNPVESKDGYVYGNFRINDNGTEKATIHGAEIGDVFTVVIEASPKDGEDFLADTGFLGGSVEKTVTVTVGADERCFISDNDNYYYDSIVGSEEKNGNTIEEKGSVREVLQYQLNQLLGTAGNSKK